ncbi:MAG: OPT family oligopeptide transporter [bacterium]|nr:OPT family oligopeptide transporter [bacterium]
MAIEQLSEEQVRQWSAQKKDKWWLENIFRGDMPQLTVRSALTGMLLGSVLSLTNLYIGIQTGWTLGVGITSVILSFAAFKTMARVGLGSEMSILENNAMQSIATAAGYMTAPLVTSLSAYMIITGKLIPMGVCFAWMVTLSLLGVLFAFPLKRRFINEEQYPFPEGRACGVVLDALHSETGAQGLYKARLLGIAAGLSALIEMLRSERVVEMIRLPFLHLPGYWDDLVYRFFTPSIASIPLRDLTVRLDSSIVMVAAGGLMGIRTGMSLLIGAVLNYWVLAPWAMNAGIIEGTGFRSILMWGMWGGVAMMTTGSLFSFFSKPGLIMQAIRGLTNRSAGAGKDDVLRDIELPGKISAFGIPVLGAIIVWMAWEFFGVAPWLGVVAIPLVFVFVTIGATSAGLTSITPTSALGYLTQTTFSVLAPGRITTNVMTAAITAEVASNTSNLLMDIKPGYMLGGKPRHQAMGHVLGIFAGGLVAIPVFYALIQYDAANLLSDKLPMPGAAAWRAVAEVLTKGLGFLHPSAQAAVFIGGGLGIIFELLKKWTKNRFPLSSVGIGLAFVISFSTSLSMALGAILFWVMGKVYRARKGSSGWKIWVENQETLCAGAIAGGAIIGIVIILIEAAA